MRETYVSQRFNARSEALIQLLNDVLIEYQRDGYILTVRQLYYQMVARGYIPNTPRSYENLDVLIGTARLAGRLDWDALEDRNRRPLLNTHWRSPTEIVQAAADQYKVDHWEGQGYHIEVMVEKDALSGVLNPICRDLDITFTANKGYSSLSYLHEVGQRLRSFKERGISPIIFYLGDHDPSGIDMT
jgi:hypothetical protein